MKTYFSIVLAAGITILGLAACSELQEEAPLDVESVRASVESTLDTFADTSNSGDLDARLEFFSDDPAFVWYEDGFLTYESREDIQNAYLSFPPGMESRTEYTDRSVHVFSADHALIMSKFTTTIGDPADGGFSFSGVATINAVRGENGWKFLAGHTSTERVRDTAY